MSILENLNERQTEAVITIDGPVLVIAGPGSGKTKVLTHRIAYIIKQKRLNPENILAVTFTNKAAQEMKNRVLDILEGENFKKNGSLNKDSVGLLPNLSYSYSFPVIGTFHSICVKILRQEAKAAGYKSSFVIYDADDQISLVKKAMKSLQINADQFNPTSVLASISGAKNDLKDPEEYAGLADGYFQENISLIYNYYQKELRESGALDFDDLIMQTIVLFRKNPEILKKYQKKFKYVMVDEYQDTNHAQYAFVNLLSREHKNLCVVGDDWQSIYKWRGADIRNILEFEKNYSDAKVVLLEQNYRSTQKILDASYHIISKNVNRKEKKLWTNKKSGKPIIVYEAADEKGEAEFIVSETARLNRGGEEKSVKLKDIAVLYRTNAQSRSIEEAFLTFGVPYKIVGGIKFYMRKEVKDMLAYLRLVQNPNDFASFERIVNVPQRGIGKTTCDKILKNAKNEKISVVDAILSYKETDITKARKEKLENLAKSIRSFVDKSSELKISELLNAVISDIGYEKYIKDGTEEGERRWENVKEIFSAVEKYDKVTALEGVKSFLEEVALATDMDQVSDEEDSVTLMTLHSAKGLEFDSVFIIGLEEGLLPHSRSIHDPSEMEEERRLCYVGITRAKNRVYLIFARVRKIYGSTQANYCSRFISDIPENLVEYRNQGYEYLEEGEDVVEVD